MVSNILSGASIGLMLGLLMGLSASPVVALVVGAIAALLGTVMLPPPKVSTHDAMASRQKTAAWRSAALSLATIAGVGAGIWLRTHDALAPPRPTLKQQVEEAVAAGFSAEEARKLVAAREFGTSAPSQQPSDPSTANIRHSILFGMDSDTCERINPSNFESITVAAAAYEAKGLGSLARVARALVHELPEEAQRKMALKAVVGALCAAS